MFPFDSNVLPQLPTRKGLMVIDFQNDFLAADGALTVNDPDGLVSRTLDLIKAFRKVGDVIWVCTKFDKLRASSLDQILATDAAPRPPIPASRPRPRPRRAPAAKNLKPDDDDAADADADADADPEAFLGPCGLPTVRPATPGVQFPVAVKDSIAPRDITFVKSDYSAFKSGQLLQMLRVKFVTELYMCGSLANVGVYATAMDAARYGYSITLVEDCCGYRSELRHCNAIQGLVDVTGCAVADSEAVVENLKPKNVPPSQPSSPVPPVVVPGRAPDTARGGRVSSAKLLEKEVAALKLDRGSSPAAATCESLPPDPECDTVSDNLEVDPELQPPPQAATGSDSPHSNGVGVIPKQVEESSTDTEKKPLTSQPAAATTKQDTMEKLPIIEVAAIHETSPTSDSEPEPEPEPEPDLVSPPEESQEKSVEQPQEELQETQGESPEESPETQKEPQEEPQASANDQAPEAEQNMPQAAEPLCEGDTTVIHNVLPQPLAEGIFEAVRGEVSWQRMSHQGGEVPRLVAVQGEVASDGSMPVYRHPADESPPLLPFSPTVLKIKAEVEKQLGHSLNHALIQFYRDGTDYISEHSDKTLDIVKGSYIANVSLGAERTMALRTKRQVKDPSGTPPHPSSSSASSSPPSGEDSKPRRISRAKLPHNSLCRMGLETNMRWLHAIRQDKRMERDKTPAELAYSCGRISLTFRRIGTFLDRDGALIWGQGAKGKTREEARPVVNGQGPEAVEMLQAFGTENHSSEFDWDTHYGSGFDVLHINNSPRLCASADPVVNMRVALMLAEYGVFYAKGSMSPPFHRRDGQDGAKDTPAAAAVPETLPIKFVDNNAAKSTVEGELAIMLYLDGVYGSGKAAGTRPSAAELAPILARFQRGLALLDKWRRLERDDDQGKRDLKPLGGELAAWDRYAAEAKFIAGPGVSLADFAVWPALHAMVDESGVDSFSANKDLKAYYERFKARTSTAKVLGAGCPGGADGAED